MPALDQPDILFSDIIGLNAKFQGNKAAIVCGADRLSWTELDLRTNKVANALLGAGLQKGDKVCLFMFNSIRMFELIWGTIKAGGVIVPLNVMMAQDALSRMVNNCEAKFLFGEPETMALIDSVRGEFENKTIQNYLLGPQPPAPWKSAEALVDSASDAEPKVSLTMADSMNIIYSSGSTGHPKGIEHSQQARHMYTMGVGNEVKIDRTSVVICSTPLYTNGTWINMLPAVYYGGTVVVMRKFNAEDYLATVERERCTHAFHVPTQFIVLLASPAIDKYDKSSLQAFISGGAPLTTTVYRQLREKFPTTRIHGMYGMTEGFITMALPHELELYEGTVGVPMFNGDIIILGADDKELPRGEIGEIAGYSAGMMKWYYNDPVRTNEMIWIGPKGRTYLKSGDIGRLDANGHLFIMGRTKDMIKSGGLNVFASDIEEVFMRHPAVKEVACIGIPHDKWGETPLLLAITKEGQKIGEDELKTWGNDKLSKFQRVSRVEFRTEFPRATHDKILKRALRDPYWEGTGRKV
jgi:acyl-CoA synthetase (AMP-forming)/AMP-acid ligase II